MTKRPDDETGPTLQSVGGNNDNLAVDSAKYVALTGRLPELDDLERVNCDTVGQAGHMACGLCPTCGQPAWTCEHFAKTVQERMERERTSRDG